MSVSQIDEFDADTCSIYACGDSFGHFLGACPHGIVDDKGFSFSLVLAPVTIGLEDIPDMGAPDNSVIRGNHINLKSQFLYLGQKLPD